jgi:hypothetical protein
VSGRAPVFAGVYAGQGRKWMRDSVVTRRARRWRMHRRCMGCEENTQGPSPQTPRPLMRGMDRSASVRRSIFWSGRIRIFASRPSTVLLLQKTAPILGSSCFLAAAGVTRMGGNRASGFRRALRAIARDPSPQAEGAAPQNRRRFDAARQGAGSSDIGLSRLPLHLK